MLANATPQIGGPKMLVRSGCVCYVKVPYSIVFIGVHALYVVIVMVPLNVRRAGTSGARTSRKKVS